MAKHCPRRFGETSPGSARPVAEASRAQVTYEPIYWRNAPLCEFSIHDKIKDNGMRAAALDTCKVSMIIPIQSLPPQPLV